jgi:hypothetical protein
MVAEVTAIPTNEKPVMVSGIATALADEPASAGSSRSA